jgi:hypothetical protein
MSSKDILTITFSLSDKPHTLEYGEGMTGRGKTDVKTITYKITDLDTKNETTGQIDNDGNKSFNQFTKDLTKSIITLRTLLPTSVNMYYEKTVVDNLNKYHDNFMKGESIVIEEAESEEKQDVKEKAEEGVLPDVEPYLLKWGKDTYKDLIKTKINENSSKSPPSKSDKIAQITKLVTNHELIKDKNTEERIKYNTAVLRDALYVGLFEYPTNNPLDSKELHVFLTNKGILTDGYAILSDRTSDVVNKDTNNLIFTSLTKTYQSLWKLANRDNNGGGLTIRNPLMGGPETKQFDYQDMEALLGDKTYTTEYDRAIYFLNKDTVYGGQKTLSNRPSKKHGTRRRR